MVNWEELKHIHVIRKLEEILAQWFHTDIFFVDDRGQVRNYDPLDRQREFKNPLAASLLPKEKGRQLVLSMMSQANERIYKGGEAHVVVPGPCGVESVFVSRIAVGDDFLGSVVAYSFVDQAPGEQAIKQARGSLEAQGVDGDSFDTAIHKLKALTPAERKYFSELVDLVAQEIVTFHTEITKREERINALNNQLGNRYSYGSMIGKSKPMQDLYGLLDKIKVSESTVMIQGE